jgi:hypothetical protein
MRKKENSGVGKIIRERMGFHSSEKQSPTHSDNEDLGGEDNTATIVSEKRGRKSKKSVKIADSPTQAGKYNDKENTSLNRVGRSKTRDDSRKSSEPRFSAKRAV